MQLTGTIADTVLLRLPDLLDFRNPMWLSNTLG